MSESRTPQDIEKEIETTREEFADTAAALAEKADVKARAHDKVDEVKGRVTGKVGALKTSAAENTPDSAASAASSATAAVKSNPVPTAAIVAAMLGFALGYMIARR
jgi:ElaB/YqjD/DUF883 family membrane-anchored ribosome-binding protein